MEDAFWEKVPAYMRVKRDILKKIKDGTWVPHSRLPSEDELTAQFKVARGTIRHALSELSHEGVIYKVHGKGTFVKAAEYEHEIDTLRFLSFWDEMIEKKVEFKNELIGIEKHIPETKVSSHLKIRPQKDEVFSIRRIRKIGEKTIMYSINHIPVYLQPNMIEYNNDLISLHELLKTKCGIEIDFAQRLIKFTSATDEVAEILGVAVGHPVIFVEQIVYDVEGRCIDDGYIWLRSENFHFLTTMRHHR